MSIHTKKYHECPEHHCDGILIVDVETEKIPRTDRQGNRYYYCLEGKHPFLVPTDEGKEKGATSKAVTMASKS